MRYSDFKNLYNYKIYYQLFRHFKPCIEIMKVRKCTYELLACCYQSVTSCILFRDLHYSVLDGQWLFDGSPLCQ